MGILKTPKHFTIRTNAERTVQLQKTGRSVEFTYGNRRYTRAAFEDCDGKTWVYFSNQFSVLGGVPGSYHYISPSGECGWR